MKSGIDLQEQLRSRGVPSSAEGVADASARVRGHLSDPLERLRSLLADARAGELEAERVGSLLDTAQELVDRVDDLDSAFEGMSGGPGPRLTLALASELSFIARHLESPLPAPTVERLQPRVRRAARLATLWLSPHEYNATTTHGPASAASAAWKTQEVAPEDASQAASPAQAGIAAPAPAPAPARAPGPAPTGDAGPELAGHAAQLILARLADLRSERRDLEERLEILDRYWRFATHEMRNAAQSLVMILDRLEESALQEAPWLAPLGRATRTLMIRSQEALDDRLISRGMFTVAPEPIDLIEVALSSLDDARPLADDRGVRLVGERLPVGQPLWAFADPQRVRQILHNLLRNAIEATPRDGFVLMEASVIDDHTCVIVRDSGAGMDPRRAAALLELGDRGAGAVDRAGLGLPICRHLAKAMDGNVVPCDVAPGMGAGFMVSLPRFRP